jgi:peptidoglycan/xylan/chitin deacetylase (PgdA/CDA1 family)
MLFWSEILEIAGNNIEIGAHTITHPNLQEEDSEEAEYEIVKSKSKLEERLRKTVRFFSYPFGRHNHQIREIVRDSGFEGAVGGTGTLSTGSCVFALNRVQIDRSISFLQFRVHLTKAADWSREIEQTIRALLRRRQV